MKIQYILIAFVLMLNISCVNGTEISLSNPQALCKWVAPEGFTSPDPNAYENVVAVGWNNNISVYYYPYTGTSSHVFVGPIGQTVEDMIFTKDYLFVAFNNGQVYRVNQWFGYFNWATDAYIGENAILITTVPTTQGTINMAIDESGYVYVSGGTYIYKINPDTLTTTASTNTALPIYSLSIGSNAIYTGTRVSTSSTAMQNYYKFPTLATYSTITYSGGGMGTTSTAYRFIYGIQELNNGNFAYLRGVGYLGTNTYGIEYGNATHYITVLDTTTHGISSDMEDNDLIVMSNGICIVAIDGLDKIFTYELESGGIDFSGSNYVPAKLIYTNTDIYTDYQNYYNGSNVDVHYATGFDVILQSPEYVSKDTILNRFNWKIELINPDGVMINSYIIPENFERTTLLSSTYYISNNVILNNINPNGTWNLNLFEIDTQTNEKSLLDSTSFEILYAQSGSMGIGAGDITIDNPIGVGENIIQSSMFYALIIILVCGGVGAAYGGGVGFVGGAVLGVVACVAFGLLPMLYVIILVIIFAGLLASGLASKITGGE